MKFINYFFFYAYVGTVILAGTWGAFINPAFDCSFMFNLDVNELPHYTKINMLSQYRFLRGIELGFGLFSIIFVKEVFSIIKFNMLFIFIMGAGIMARITSIVFDGSPSNLMYFFLLFEIVGWFIILYYSLRHVYLIKSPTTVK